MEKRVFTSSLFAAFLIVAALFCLAPGVAVAADAAPELHNPTINDDGITTWDCVYFGRYPQGKDSNGNFVVEPIKWRVLAVNGNEAFLLSDKNIDSVPYNVMESDPWFYCYWHNCTLRSWLNGLDASVNKSGVDYTTDNFIDKAFTPEEQDAIIVAEVENNKPIEWGHNPEDTIFVTTYDKVYLLHYYDALNSEYGFPEDDEPASSRVALNTAYTASGGTCQSVLMEPENAKDSWVLRSPGEYSMYCDFITAEGEYDDMLVDANLITATDHGVRPVINLDLTKTKLYSYAGTFSALNDQKITVSSQFSKKLGDPAFDLKASTSGDGELTYTSDNTTIATVDASGVVTINGVGTAHILVTASQTDKYFEASKQVTVKVADNPDIVREEQTITVEDSFAKTLGDDPFNLNAKTSGDGVLSYASDNESVATVDEFGLVTLVGVGTARITVTANQSLNCLEASKEVLVQVEAAPAPPAPTPAAEKAVAKITVKKTSYKVKFKKLKKKASSFSIGAKATGNGKLKCARISGNKKITVAKNGKVTIKKGLKKGTYTVKIKITTTETATYKAGSKKVTITVKVK